MVCYYNVYKLKKINDLVQSRLFKVNTIKSIDINFSMTDIDCQKSWLSKGLNAENNYFEEIFSGIEILIPTQ